MLQGALAPRLERRVAGEVLRIDDAAAAHAGPGGATSARRVGPGDVDGCQVAVPEARPGYGPHVLGLVALGIAHPGHTVARLLAGDAADALEQCLLVLCT